jgi:molybdopterin/thiamine biosynthesis adenylyltransferase
MAQQGGPAAMMAGGMGGGDGLGGIVQQLILKKLLGGKEEKPPDMMQQLMGLGQMFEQLTGFFSMVVNAVDSMRGNILEQRHREAQIDKLEAESQATVLRAMNPSRKTGGSKK